MMEIILVMENLMKKNKENYFNNPCWNIEGKIKNKKHKMINLFKSKIKVRCNKIQLVPKFKSKKKSKKKLVLLLILNLI